MDSARRRRSGRVVGWVGVLAVAAALATLVPTAAVARTASPPPKVKPAHAAHGAFVRPTAKAPPSSGGTTRLGFCGGDDWEPNLAVDAATNHVYAVWAHYPGATACDPASGNANRIYISVSSDGGQTFGAPHVVANLVGGVSYPSQVDCVVAVSDDGTVYVSFLAYGLKGGTDVAVARSTDFGATFTAVKVNSTCSNCDHPWTVAHGQNVYTVYAQAKAHILARSSDGGRTWTESVVLNADTVAFPEGGVIDAAGNAWFAWGDCLKNNCLGAPAANYRVSKTLAGTSTTSFQLVAQGDQGPACPFKSCGFAFFGPQDDIAIDGGGNLYLVWQDGQVPGVPGSPPVVNLSRSTDGGASWQLVGRVDDKTASGCAGASCYALFPRISGGAANRIGVVWMDDRNGSPIDHMNGWNVWYRSSTTGGTSWSSPGRRISTYDPSLAESKPNGFGFPYGDYQELVLAGTQAHAVWGEGINYDGGPSAPGHVVSASFAA
jgi:hypothetical protein